MTEQLSDSKALAAADYLLKYMQKRRPGPRMGRLLDMIHHLEHPEPGRLIFILPMGGETMLTRFFERWLDLDIPTHDVYTTQGVYLPSAHNGMVARALERKDWTGAVFLEHDHDFDPAMVHRMRSYARMPEPPDIVGSMYMTRNDDEPSPMVGEWVDEAAFKITYMKPSHALELLAEPDVLHPVDFVPMGCTYVSRRVFETIPPPWFRAIVNPHDPEDDIGDDVYFCQLAKRHGFKLFCDTALDTGHFGIKRHGAHSWLRELRYRFLEKEFGHLVPKVLQP